MVSPGRHARCVVSPCPFDRRLEAKAQAQCFNAINKWIFVKERTGCRQERLCNCLDSFAGRPGYLRFFRYCLCLRSFRACTCVRGLTQSVKYEVKALRLAATPL